MVAINTKLESLIPEGMNPRAKTHPILRALQLASFCCRLVWSQRRSLRLTACDMKNKDVLSMSTLIYERLFRYSVSADTLAWASHGTQCVLELSSKCYKSNMREGYFN